MAQKRKFKKSKQNSGDRFPMIIFGSIFLFMIGITLVFTVPRLLVAIGAVVLIYQLTRMRILQSTRRDFGFLGNEEDQIKYILALAAYLTKSNNTSRTAEKNHIEDSIRHDFKEKYSEKYIAQFNHYLSININLRHICVTLRAQYDISSSIHLLHFLLGLVAVDGLLSREEEHKLYAIARHLRLPSSSMRSIIGMFKMRREDDSQSRSNNRNNKSYNSTTALSNAYAFLDLSTEASNEKLKKVFRKLAKLHHPDKAVHLGEKYQEKAKVHFQKIMDAYELIKKSRNLA